MFMFLVGVLVIILYLLRRRYLSRTVKLREHGDKIPGPKPLPIIGNALLNFGRTKKPMFEYVIWLTRTYGPIARIWIGHQLGILLADPQYVEPLLSNNNFGKSSVYRFSADWVGESLLVNKGELWKKHRKIVAPTFQGQILTKFVDIFNSNLDVLIEKLSRLQNGPDFDIFPLMTLFALDVICETAMGVKLKVQLQSDSDYSNSVQRLEKLIFLRALRPWLHPELVFRLSPLGRQQAKHLPVVLNMTKQVLKECRRTRAAGSIPDIEGREEDEATGIRKRKAFLHYLLDYIDDGGQLTNQEVEDEVNTILVAGHETTAVNLGFTCWLLAKHQDVQEKVVAELETIFGDSLRHCTAQDLPQMKYLEQVIKESLRLYPPAPFFGRAVSEDIITDKYVIPAGSEVGINVYMLHRHPDYFPDPEKFDPDRFLPENCVGRHPYCYIPFGGGQRVCLGYKYALYEVKTAISQILRHFKILPAGPPFMDLDLTIQIILKSRNGIHIRLEPRSNLSHQ